MEDVAVSCHALLKPASFLILFRTSFLGNGAAHSRLGTPTSINNPDSTHGNGHRSKWSMQSSTGAFLSDDCVNLTVKAKEDSPLNHKAYVFPDYFISIILLICFCSDII